MLLLNTWTNSWRLTAEPDLKSASGPIWRYVIHPIITHYTNYPLDDTSSPLIKLNAIMMSYWRKMSKVDWFNWWPTSPSDSNAIIDTYLINLINNGIELFVRLLTPFYLFYASHPTSSLLPFLPPLPLPSLPFKRAGRPVLTEVDHDELDARLMLMKQTDFASFAWQGTIFHRYSLLLLSPVSSSVLPPPSFHLPLSSSFFMHHLPLLNLFPALIHDMFAVI